MVSWLTDQRILMLLLLLSALLTTSSAAAVASSIYLTLVYCPDVFKGEGAIVKIHHNGTYHVVSKFNYPGSIDAACPMEESSNFHSDTVLGTRNTYLSFTSEWGMEVSLNLDQGKMVQHATGSSGDSFLFDGFTSFVLSNDRASFLGLAPHVTESGFCNDGCFRFGIQHLKSGVFLGLNNTGVPFKSVMTNAGFLDRTKGIYYAQGSYGLTHAAQCDSNDDTVQCLFSINSTTGTFIESKKMTNFEVYHYEDFANTTDDKGDVVAWVFHEDCGQVNGEERGGSNNLDSYGFARVNLGQGTARVISCINTTSTIVHTTPDYSAFDSTLSTFVAASGNPETGEMQVLVFDVATGKTLLDSKLLGLKLLLGVSNIAPFVQVWGVSQLPDVERVENS